MNRMIVEQQDIRRSARLAVPQDVQNGNLLTRPTLARQDAPFREQGRRRIKTGGGTDRTS